MNILDALIKLFYPEADVESISVLTKIFVIVLLAILIIGIGLLAI